MEENAVKIIINGDKEYTVGAFDGGKVFWFRSSEEPDDKIHILVVESDHRCSYYHGGCKIISEVLRAEGSNELADAVIKGGYDQMLLSDKERGSFTLWPCNFKKPGKADLDEFIRYFWNGADYKIADRAY